ncbi:MAG: hypothetical protein AMXMBFR58_19200 [Phycisphaerae bacterium]
MVSISVCSTGARAQASFTFLIAPWQTWGSRFEWIGSDGTAAVGTCDNRVTRWTAEGGYENRGVGRGLLGGDATTLVVGSQDGGMYTSFFFYAADGSVTHIDNGCHGTAFGLSSNGTCFLWGEDTGCGEGYLAAQGWGDCISFNATWLKAVSADGQYLVGEYTYKDWNGSATYGPALYTPIGAVALNWGSWHYFSATAISRNGRIVAGVRQEAATDVWRLYTLADMLDWQTYAFDVIDGLNAPPADVSDDGGIMRLRYGPTHGLWSRTRGSAEINKLVAPLGIVPAGWRIEELTDMSSDGRALIGVAKSTVSGNSVGFIMTLPAICPADLDWNWAVDAKDFNLFMALYMSGVEKADIDGSGYVDTDDLDAFVKAFESGC